MEFEYPADFGDWTSNGFGMVTPAMKPLNLEIVHTPPPPKGSNVDLFGVSGTLPRQMYDNEAVHVIAFQLLGDVDHTGTPTAGTTKAGIFANYPRCAPSSPAQRGAARHAFSCSPGLTVST